LNSKPRIRLYYEDDGGTQRLDFCLHELVRIHPSVLKSLQAVRDWLNSPEHYGGGVRIRVTDAARTEADNEVLADRLGWNVVSRTSKHLVTTIEPESGRAWCLAVDFIAIDTAEGERVPQDLLGAVAEMFFDWVSIDYADGHVHADNRNGGRRV